MFSYFGCIWFVIWTTVPECQASLIVVGSTIIWCRVFWTSFIQISKVYAYPDLSIFLFFFLLVLYGHPCMILYFPDNLSFYELLIAASILEAMLGCIHLGLYFTGGLYGVTDRWCMITMGRNWAFSNMYMRNHHCFS